MMWTPTNILVGLQLWLQGFKKKNWDSDFESSP